MSQDWKKEEPLDQEAWFEQSGIVRVNRTSDRVRRARVSEPCPEDEPTTEPADAGEGRAPNRAELYRQYRRHAGQLRRQVLQASTELDHLLQEVFVTALQSAPEERSPRRLRAWLGTVSRRMKKQRRSSPPPAVASAEPAVAGDAQRGRSERDEPPVSRVRSTAPMAALMQLPSELSAVWILSHREGMTLEQIAAYCGCTVAKAERKLRHAEDELAALMTSLSERPKAMGE